MPDPLAALVATRARQRKQKPDPFKALVAKRAEEIYGAKEPRGVVAGLKDVGSAIRHPIETVKGMGNAIAEGFNTASSPIQGMPKNILGNLVRGRPQERVSAEDEGSVTPGEFGKGAFDSAVNVGFALAPALGLAARTAANAGLGALHSPDDRLRGATSGLALGEVLHGAPKVIGKGIGKVAKLSRTVKTETPPLAEKVAARAVEREIQPDNTPRISVEEANKRVTDAVEAQKAAQEKQRIRRSKWAPGESIRDDAGALRKDLTNVPDEVLETELQRITEQNASEESTAAAVRESGYRADYEELPRTERLGQKGQEDLPDADGMLDPDRLASDNKTVSEYNKNTIVRAARARAAARLEAELAARKPEKYRRIEDEPARVEDKLPPERIPGEEIDEPDTSFDFGGNKETPPTDILNVAKLNLDKPAQDRVVAQLEQHRALRDANRQTFAEADVNRAEIMRELQGGDPIALNPAAAKRLSGEELLARRDVVSQNDAMISELSKTIESKTLSVAEHEQATALLEKAVEHNDALLSDLVTGSSQKGRDLNLLRRIANRDLDPATWQIQAKRMLGDRPLTDEIGATIRKLANEAKEACG